MIFKLCSSRLGVLPPPTSQFNRKVKGKTIPGHLAATTGFRHGNITKPPSMVQNPAKTHSPSSRPQVVHNHKDSERIKMSMLCKPNGPPRSHPQGSGGVKGNVKRSNKTLHHNTGYLFRGPGLAPAAGATTFFSSSSSVSAHTPSAKSSCVGSAFGNAGAGRERITARDSVVSMGCAN